MKLTALSISSIGALLASTASFADGPAPIEISDASAVAMVSQSLALGGNFGNGAFLITPSWSEELGGSVTGAVGAELEEGSAIGLIVTTGERKREALINFGLSIDDSRQIILSAGQLHEKLQFGIAGGQEWVKQSEFGLAYEASNYSFNAYHVDSETTANFSGSKATGLDMGGSVELSSMTNLDYTAGYQKLEWDVGSTSDEGLTASVDLVHQLDADMFLSVSAGHFVSANTYGIGATWNLGDATLSASYNYRDTLVGSGADDRNVSLTFSVPFGSTRSSSGISVVSSSGANSMRQNLIADVMKRPTFLPMYQTLNSASSMMSCLATPGDVVVSDLYWYQGTPGGITVAISSATDLSAYPVSISYEGGLDMAYGGSYAANTYWFSADLTGSDPIDGTTYQITIGCDSISDSSIYED
ncbi:MAG: hypothetical protein HWD81_05060 [Marivivens sp.]|nr:hypothetical protein [Marivivens sp.]